MFVEIARTRQKLGSACLPWKGTPRRHAGDAFLDADGVPGAGSDTAYPLAARRRPGPSARSRASRGTRRDSRPRGVDRESPRRARVSLGAMKRVDSLRDVSAIASHFPTYLEQRVKTESWAQEALQYAAWLPLALGARALGWNTVAYLFLTWFILGEALNVYVRQTYVRLRWWQVLLGVVLVHVYFGAELTLETNSYWRFLVSYVIGGIVFLAAATPLLPRAFLRAAPEFLFGFFGFLKQPDPVSAAVKETKAEKAE